MATLQYLLLYTCIIQMSIAIYQLEMIDRIAPIFFKVYRNFCRLRKIKHFMERNFVDHPISHAFKKTEFFFERHLIFVHVVSGQSTKSAKNMHLKNIVLYMWYSILIQIN